MKRHRARHKGLLGVAVLAASAVVLLLPAGATAIVAGAGFTTDNPNQNYICSHGPAHTTPAVNCNLYPSKDAVWTNGGPSGGQNTLTDGEYFFAVLVPGGQGGNENPNDDTTNNLSDDFDAWTNRTFTVTGGKISAYSGTHNQDATFVDPNGLLVQLAPYADTTNPGGVYIMAICAVPSVPALTNPPGVTPSACKYDAFKAPDSDCVVDCEVDPFGSVAGKKYYDANLNGQLDPGEVGIANWLIDWTDGASGTETTDASGNFSRPDLVADTYTFTERQSSNPQWIQTGNTVPQVEPLANLDSLSGFVYKLIVEDNVAITGVNFGNVCVGAGGGLTLGFWSNKNGGKILSANSNAILNGVLALNLRKADGSLLASVNLANFQKWLLAATATNMAYMLSAQLAAMKANVLNGNVNGGDLIYAPGTLSANALGFASVNAVMTEANAELGLHGLTVAAGPFRTYQEALKNALDKANNNLNFLQPGPANCPVTFAP